MEFNPYQRQGQMDHLQSYFYTDSIFQHKSLLKDDKTKLIIIESLQYLVRSGKIVIYGYVIMPTHIHLIWEILSLNGNESPAGSLAKFTAHKFKVYLNSKNPIELEDYRSNKRDRKYQFWNRDPLAIALTSEKSFKQKLEYMHFNPVVGKWNLADSPENYHWSSAKFYDTGIDEFGIVSDYRL
ncbi:MAG: transposase [Ginsengibacter sp.]